MVSLSPVKMLESKGFSNFASGAAGAVYATTAIKAAVRPAVIYNDKHSDAQTKKYTASKEFIYQMLCLGVALSIVPLFRKGGFAIAKHNLKALTNKQDITTLKEAFIKKIKSESKKQNISDKLEKIKNLKIKDASNSEFDGLFKVMKETNKLSEKTKTTMQRVHGGEVLGEFTGSILGLTILAPILSMKCLHPILKACGIEKNEK